VGAVLVVVDQETPGRLTHILQSGEDVLIQHLFPIGAIEAFDERVLIRFARLDVTTGHAVGFGPLREDLAQELRAVVGAQHLWQRALLTDALEDAHQAMRSVGSTSPN
jgi:hypothetical protein